MQTYQSPRGAEQAAAEEKHCDASLGNGRLHGPTVSLGCTSGMLGRRSAASPRLWGSRPEHLLGHLPHCGPSWAPGSATGIYLLTGSPGEGVSPPIILAPIHSPSPAGFKQLPESVQTIPTRMGMAEVYWLSPRC